MSSETTGNREIASEQACVVYDATTGRIRHVHRVVTLGGGTEPKRSDIEARALEIARRTHKGTRTMQVKTLMVAPDQLQAGSTHKVDPKKRSLISTPIEVKATRSGR
jgi:hypothetical protein